MISLTTAQKNALLESSLTETTHWKLYLGAKNRSNRIYDSGIKTPLVDSSSWTGTVGVSSVETKFGQNSFSAAGSAEGPVGFSFYQYLNKKNTDYGLLYLEKKVRRLEAGKRYVLSLYYKMVSYIGEADFDILVDGPAGTKSIANIPLDYNIGHTAITCDWTRKEVAFTAAHADVGAIMPEEVCLWANIVVDNEAGRLYIACPMLHEDVQLADLTWHGLALPYIPLEPFINTGVDDGVDLTNVLPGFSLTSKALFDSGDQIQLPSGTLNVFNEELLWNPTAYNDSFDIATEKYIGKKQVDGFGMFRAGNRIVGWNTYTDTNDVSFNVPIGVFVIEEIKSDISAGTITIELSNYWSDLARPVSMEIIGDAEYSDDIIRAMAILSGYNVEQDDDYLITTGSFNINKIFLVDTNDRALDILQQIAVANRKAMFVNQQSQLVFRDITTSYTDSTITLGEDHVVKIEPDTGATVSTVVVKSDPLIIQDAEGKRTDNTKEAGNIDASKFSSGNPYLYALADANVVNATDITPSSGFDHLFDGTTNISSHSPYALANGYGTGTTTEVSVPYIELDMGQGASAISALHLWFDSRSGENYFFKVSVSLDRQKWWYLAGDATSFARSNPDKFENHKTVVGGFAKQWVRYVRVYMNGNDETLVNQIFDLQIFRDSFQSSFIGWEGTGYGTVEMSAQGIKTWKNEAHTDANITFEVLSRTGHTRIRGKGISTESDPILHIEGTASSGFKIFDGAVTAYNQAGSKTFCIDTATGNVTLTGTITATLGAIGGFTISATDLTAGATNDTAVGVSSSDTKPAFWAGNLTPGSAPVRIYHCGCIVAACATIGGFDVTGATNGFVASSGATAIKAVPGTGFWFGADAFADALFSVSNTGEIKSCCGVIGGWTIKPGYLYCENVGTPAESAGMSPVDYPFYAGIAYANRATAPFRVAKDGSVTATNATISGTITATLGTIGGFTVSATDGLYAGTGITRVQMKPGAGFWAGADAQASAPFSVTQAGSLCAICGLIGGWCLAADCLYNSCNDGFGNTQSTKHNVWCSCFSSSADGPSVCCSYLYSSGIISKTTAPLGCLLCSSHSYLSISFCNSQYGILVSCSCLTGSGLVVCSVASSGCFGPVDSSYFYITTTKPVNICNCLKIGAYTLPNIDGASNNVLVTDGAGNVSWAAQGAAVGGYVPYVNGTCNLLLGNYNLCTNCCVCAAGCICAGVNIYATGFICAGSYHKATTYVCAGSFVQATTYVCSGTCAAIGTCICAGTSICAVAGNILTSCCFCSTGPSCTAACFVAGTCVYATTCVRALNNILTDCCFSATGCVCAGQNVYAGGFICAGSYLKASTYVCSGTCVYAATSIHALGGNITTACCICATGAICSAACLYAGTCVYAANNILTACCFCSTGNICTAAGLNVVGNATFCTIRTYGTTRQLPIVVNDIVEIGHITTTAGNVEVKVDVSCTGIAVAKSYMIPLRYSGAGAVWQIVNPVVDSAPYASQDFELDIFSDAGLHCFRLRRTCGTTAGLATITFKTFDATGALTCTSATATVSAPTTFYAPTAFRSVSGRVGIGIIAPSVALHVVGAICGTLNITTACCICSTGLICSAASVTSGTFACATSYLRSGTYICAGSFIQSATYLCSGACVAATTCGCFGTSVCAVAGNISTACCLFATGCVLSTGMHCSAGNICSGGCIVSTGMMYANSMFCSYTLNASTIPWDSSGNLVLRNGCCINNTWAGIEFKSPTGTITSGMAAQNYDYVNHYAVLHFGVRGAGGWNACVMSIKDGKVGVLTASPSYPLHVTGAICGSTTITSGGAICSTTCLCAGTCVYAGTCIFAVNNILTNCCVCAAGYVCAGALRVGVDGLITMIPGSNNRTGYLEWYRGSCDGSTRIAYMGFCAYGACNLNLALDNGACFVVSNGTVCATGNFSAGTCIYATTCICAGTSIHAVGGNITTACCFCSTGRICSGTGVTLTGLLCVIGSTSIAMDNQQTMSAKNSGGTQEIFIWPRWSDNIMYLNYGSGGLNIRNNSGLSKMFISNTGHVCFTCCTCAAGPVCTASCLYATLHVCAACNLYASCCAVVSGLVCSCTCFLGPVVQSTIFASGLSGFKIDQAGNAEFNNALIRGELRTTVFKYEEISAIGGQILASNASTLLVCATTAAAIGSTYCICVKDNADSGHANSSTFSVGDVLRMKTFTGGTTVVDAWGVVTSRTDNTTYWSYTVAHCSGSCSAVIPKSVAVVSYGPVSTGGSVLINGQGTCSPYVDIFTNSATPWNCLNPRVRLGCLSGVSGCKGSPTGWGLWTDNGMIVGGVVMSNNWCTNTGSCFDLTNGTFAMGGSSAPKLCWNGTTLAITGTVTACDGSNIAGWVTTPTYICSPGATSEKIILHSSEKSIYSYTSTGIGSYAMHGNMYQNSAYTHGWGFSVTNGLTGPWAAAMGFAHSGTVTLPSTTVVAQGCPFFYVGSTDTAFLQYYNGLVCVRGSICTCSGTIGAWTITCQDIGKVTGSYYIGMGAWAGHSTAYGHHFYSGTSSGANLITIGRCLYDATAGAWCDTYGIIVNVGTKQYFRISSAADGTSPIAQIAGWNFDSAKMHAGSGLGSGVNLVMATANSGSGYAYTNSQILQGYAMTWHYANNAGHLVLGQMMATVNTLKTDFYGIQMMDHLGCEYFALGGKMGVSCREAYNRIGGACFTSDAVCSLNYSASAGWALINSTGQIVANCGIIGKNLCITVGALDNCGSGNAALFITCLYYCPNVLSNYLRFAQCYDSGGWCNCSQVQVIGTVPGGVGAGCFGIQANTCYLNCNSQCFSIMTWNCSSTTTLPIIYACTNIGSQVACLVTTVAGGVALCAVGHVQTSANAHLKARYTTSDAYSSSVSWFHAQLGNNGPNYIIGGRTAVGGSLSFIVNNTIDGGVYGTPHNGYEAMTITSGAAVVANYNMISPFFESNNTYSWTGDCFGLASCAAPYNVPEVAVPVGGYFIPFLKAKSVITGVGYRDYYSIGGLRGNSGWGCLYFAVGGSDYYPTSYYYMAGDGASGGIGFGHSSGNLTILGEQCNTGWIRTASGTATGIYFPSATVCMYSETTNEVAFKGGSGTNTGLIFKRADGTVNGAIWSDSTVVGFLGPSKSWRFLVGDTYAIVCSGLLYAKCGTVISRQGNFGCYDSTQTQGIWSIGTAYAISEASNNAGNAYGMVYNYDSYGVGIAGFNHQIVGVNNGVRGWSLGLEGKAHFRDSVGIRNAITTGAALEVYSGVAWSAGWHDNIRVHSTTYPAIRFFASNANMTSYIGNNNDGGLYFGIAGIGDAAGTTGMVISPYGNVGIGVTNPGKILTIKTNDYLGWEYTAGSGTSYHTITAGGTNPMAFCWNISTGDYTAYSFGGGNGNILTLKNNGNVGIGTTAPGSPLVVSYAGTFGFEVGRYCDYMYLQSYYPTSSVYCKMMFLASQFVFTAGPLCVNCWTTSAACAIWACACRFAVYGCATNYYGVYGITGNCIGVMGEAACYGVYGNASVNVAVHGQSGGACSVTGNTAYCSVSNKFLKVEIESDTSVGILSKLKCVNIPRWQWHDRNTRSFDEQISPYDMEFATVFGVGGIEGGVNATNLAGVALAGVKELDSCFEDQKSCIIDLKSCIMSLETRLSCLEARLN